ncbi:hypothetical protein C8Q73DRAFT_27433 [Cubamyces lactineus]|nr:hypothetical protein C8Q73DRAFT_27433 [Cubamyces lactineus]
MIEGAHVGADASSLARVPCDDGPARERTARHNANDIHMRPLLSREVGSPGSLRGCMITRLGRRNVLAIDRPQRRSERNIRHAAKGQDATTAYAPIQARELQSVATSAASMRIASGGPRRRAQLSRRGLCFRVRSYSKNLGKRHDDGPLPC